VGPNPTPTAMERSWRGRYYITVRRLEGIAIRQALSLHQPRLRVAGGADINGALNITHLGASVMIPGGPPLCCLYQPGGRATASPTALALGA